MKIASWNALLRLGNDADLVDYKLVLIRRLSAIALVFIVSFIILNIVMEYPLVNTLIDVAGLLLVIVVWITAARRKVMLAGLTMTIGLVGAITVASVVTYSELRNNGTENLIMAMIVVIAAFFDGRLRVILFVLSFALLIYLKQLKIDVLGLPSDSDFVVELIIVAVISCGIYFATSFFKLGLLRNLDRVNSLNLTLADQSKTLTKLNREKDDLIGIVAHDLKNPLNVFNGMLPILEKGLSEKLTKEQAKMFRMMRESSQGMAQHVDQILHVNRFETQRINLNLQKLDICKLLQKSIDLYEHSGEVKNIKIEASLIPDKCFAMVDENCTKSVFENLLSNAIKYTPKGKSIHLALEETDLKIIAKFQDAGPGISVKDREMLFKKYQPLSTKPTGSESSTGMGLFTVKKYLTAMNGTIEVESEPGETTTFIVALPKA
ncbi:MAG: HAMP domain-containing sensor histidine kinase [Cyclobacteriaceae bacterium]